MHRFPALALLILSFSILDAHGFTQQGNRLVPLDGIDLYAPSEDYPKLITPQWVGEAGVEAVVVLSIDDMREPEKYETYLRPILDRLKAIDGRAPVSILANELKNPDDELIRRFLAEGVNLGVHTVDHPCPLLQLGGLEKARESYERCVDQLARIPGNRTTAYRMPCCDSMNSPSPRFFSEIFSRPTASGNFLTIDTSVFTLPTADDPRLPRELVRQEDGADRLRRYVPNEGEFVNVIENYPYPYVIGNTCWEIPCTVPSDWEGQKLNTPNHPQTLEDMKASLDMTVIQQGIYCLVFHPHGWIENSQVVELIDHAVRKHGSKVKFLNYAEIEERLNKNVLDGNPLRALDGSDNGARVLDVNRDGYMDVVVGNESKKQTRVWSPVDGDWETGSFPTEIVAQDSQGKPSATGVQFGVWSESGVAACLVRNGTTAGAWEFADGEWAERAERTTGLDPESGPVMTSLDGVDQGTRFLDIDGDGVCELISAGPNAREVLRWDDSERAWKAVGWDLPKDVAFVDGQGRDAGLRFADLNDDGKLDLLFSNEKRYHVALFDGFEKGFATLVTEGERVDEEGGLPAFAKNGQDNGAWFMGRCIYYQNELTGKRKFQVYKLSFNDLLAKITPPPRSPEESLVAMKPRPGFRVELVAAEPLTMDPIAFDWDDQGRLWVVEMADYPSGIDGQGKPGGRVRFLEDIDGDGKYDKSTLFLTDLSYPTGIHPWGKGVLVTCTPEVFYAEDTDGDGKADIQETWYSGFGAWNPQHRANGFAVDLDGWIHVANGDSSGEIVSEKTSASVNLRGRDLLIRPGDRGIDTETGQSQFGRARDDWGSWFGCNNSVPYYHFVLSDRYLRRNPHVAAKELIWPLLEPKWNPPVHPTSFTRQRYNDQHTFECITSACGLNFYRDDLYGAGFPGDVFVCEPVHNLVMRAKLVEDGVTYTAQRGSDEVRSEFLSSTDAWFRPVTVRTGPDGCLWVADMYRWEIEHPDYIPEENQRATDFRAGEDRGRIYRVVPVHQSPRAIPKLAEKSSAELASALESPSGWLRDRAQLILDQRQDKSVAPQLERMASSSDSPLARMHALCALALLDSLKPALVQSALLDSHAGVRRQAVRLAERFFADPAGLGESVAALADDVDDHVRLQVASSLGEWKTVESGRTLGRMAIAAGTDEFKQAAVMSSISESHVAGVMESIRDQVIRSNPPTPELMKKAATLAHRYNSPSALEAMFSALESGIIGDPTPTWKLAAVDGFLSGIERDGGSVADYFARAEATVSAGSRVLTHLVESARAMAANEEATEEVRLAAIGLLGRGVGKADEDEATLAGLLAPWNSAALQRAAVDALAELKVDDVPQVLLANWGGFGPELRGRVLDLLLGREAWLDVLLSGLESGAVRPADVDAARRQRILEDDEAERVDRAKAVFGRTQESDRAVVLEKFAAAGSLPGNAERGKVFFDELCAKCHKIGDEGFAIGPDLGSITDRTPRALLIAIIDPNRNIESKYVNYVAETYDGTMVTGVITQETGNSLTLASGGEESLTVLRSDLESLTTSGKSLMPEALEEGKTPQDIADLIAYVRGHTPPPKSFEGNEPSVVTAESDGSLRLLASKCEIYGDTLVFEPEHQNLGYWSSYSDVAVWSVEVPLTGDYEVWLDFAMDPGQDGKRYAVDAGDSLVTGEVESTGSWETFEVKKVGEMLLKAGLQSIVFRSNGHLAGNLIDLREVRLVPIGKKADAE